nr:ImcF-related family protein [Endozoicomonas sp.]
MNSYLIKIIKLICFIIGIVSFIPLALLALFFGWTSAFFFLAVGGGIFLCVGLLLTFYERRRELRDREVYSYVSAFLAKEITRGSRYNRPLFLVFSDNNRALDQFFNTMELELFMPQVAKDKFVEAWYGKQCLLLHVNKLEALGTPGWNTMLTLVKQSRPRQPFNGVLVDFPLAILSLSPEQQDTYFDCVYKYTCHVVSSLQQKLPTLFMLSGMAQLTGFDAFCKSLHRDELACTLGAIRPKDSPADMEHWFNSSWQKFLQQIYLRQSEFIGLIYDSKKANESIDILFQMSVLGDQMKSFITRYSEAMLTKGVDIAGYFICPISSGDNNRCYDYVTTYCQSHFSSGGRENFGTVSAEYHNVFLRNIFQHFLMPIAARAGVNKKAQFWYHFFSVSGYSFYCLFLYLAGLWLYDNYMAEKDINNMTRQVVRAYKSNTDLLVRDKGMIGSLPVMLEKLNSLVDMLEEYKQTPQILMASRLSHSSLQKMLHDYYYEQLRLRLAPYLISAFSNSLKLQVQKESVLGIFESLRLYLMLFDSSQLATSELIARSLSLLVESAGLNRLSAHKLEKLLQDYFGLHDYVFYAPDLALIYGARGKLQGMTEAFLVYSRIKVMQNFKQTIPVANIMGPHFNDVFVISNESSCNKDQSVLFTAGGWHNHLLSPDSPLIISSIQDNWRTQGINDEVSLEVAASTVDSVKRRFAQEYIAHWHNIMRCIRLRNAGSINELTDIVTFLARLGVSPMTDVLNAVKAHTLFQVVVRENRLGSEEGSTNEGNDFLTQYNYLTESYNHDRFLASAFTDYHRLVDDSNGSEFSRNFHKHLEEVLENLIHLRSADNPMDIAFRQVRQLVIGHHPVQALSLLAEGQPLAVRQWIKQLISQWGKLYFRLAKQYIENQWLKELVTPWHQSIAGRFPVYGNSAQQIDLDTFQAVFGPNGWIDAFHSFYIKPFLVTSNRLSLSENESFRFTPEAQTFFNRAEVIRKFFFNGTGEQVDGSLNIRVLSLSSNSTHYQLDDGYNGVVYRHGPSLWQKSDLHVGDDERVLTSSFHDAGQQQSVKTYSGPWAWIRFMRESVLEKGNDKAVILRHTQGHHQSTISIKATSGKNIEALMTSFKRISIPESIFL